MRASVPFRRQPTALERVLGRRRARVLRRRLGFVAIGVGLSLVRPRRPLAPVLVVLGSVALAGALVVSVA